MNIRLLHKVKILFVAVALSMTVAGCGHYPEPIRSAADIDHTSPAETMIVIFSLPLEDWPRLQKFESLEHFHLNGEMIRDVADSHVKILSQLKFPKLRQVDLANCARVTDIGLQALTNLSSIQGLGLSGTSITDRGMQILAMDFPNLSGIGVAECRLLTPNGFVVLTNSKTITEVGLSFDSLSQSQLENIISTVSNVTWWTIEDPDERLNRTSLRKLGESRKITIQVADRNHLVTSITLQQSGVTNVASATNQTPSASGLHR